MGMEAINGYSPLIQQTQPVAKTQIKEQSQADSNIVSHEAESADTNIELKVETADNAGSYNNGDSQGSEQLFAQSQQRAEATEDQIKADNAKVKKAISEMTQNTRSSAEAVFGIHEKTNRVTIKMVDRETKKVIKEFPPEETLDMIAKVWELAGIMVDEKR